MKTRPGRFQRLGRLTSLWLLVVIAVACGDGGEAVVSEARPISGLPQGTGGADDLAGRLGFTRPAPPPAVKTAAGPPSFSYDLPEGWRGLAPTEHRQINLKIDSAPATEAYVTILGGVGGGIAANLDRWRGQMSLPPYTPEQRRELPVIEVGGRPGILVDFEGTFKGMGGPERDGYRLLGAIFEEAGYGVFVKLVGPKAEVEGERERFLRFTTTLVADRADPHAGHARAAPASFDPGSLAWTAPDGWVKGADRSMRSVTYHPGGDVKAECSVIVLSGDAGGLEANVNRWYGQVGRPPLTAEAIDKLGTVEILGRPSPIVDAVGSFQGMSGPELEDAALLGAICQLETHSIYVKLTGPRAVVERERENFLSFCRSLR